jgi:hypothetical protein
MLGAFFFKRRELWRQIVLRRCNALAALSKVF